MDEKEFAELVEGIFNRGDWFTDDYVPFEDMIPLRVLKTFKFIG